MNSNTNNSSRINDNHIWYLMLIITAIGLFVYFVLGYMLALFVLIVSVPFCTFPIYKRLRKN